MKKVTITLEFDNIEPTEKNVLNYLLELIEDENLDFTIEEVNERN